MMSVVLNATKNLVRFPAFSTSLTPSCSIDLLPTFLNVLEMVTIEHLGSASLFFQRFLDEYNETQSHAFRIEAIFLGKLEQSESQLFSF